MKFINFLSCCLCLLIFSACNSIYVRLPVSRFDSPEVPGETKKIRFGAGLGSTQDVLVVSDGSLRPPNIGVPKASGSYDIPVRCSMGFSDWFEIGARAAPFISPFTFFGKFQFIGNPALKSTKGNFSTAFTFARGFSTSNASGDQLGTFGPGGYKWSASAATLSDDFALIAGYRLSDGVLIFGGPFIVKYAMSGNVHQDRSDNGSSPEANYSLSGAGQSTGANLALQLGVPKNYISFTLEGVWSTLQWTNTATTTYLQAGGILEFLF